MQKYFLIFLLGATGAACTNNTVTTKPAAEQTEPDWTLLSFRKADSVNPVMTADATLTFVCPILKKEVRWAEKDVFNPAAIVRNDTVFLIFRAEDSIGKYAGTSRIGLAWSLDGMHFHKYAAPVLYPDNDAYKNYEWEGGCEDPRVVQGADKNYYMTYTAYDGDKARLMVASSPDLHHWTKWGPAFAKAYAGKYTATWSKSGAIVSEYKNQTIVAAKIKGRYWMLWGDVNIGAATSDDLINWTPVLYAPGEKPSIELRRTAKETPELKIVFGPVKRSLTVTW